MLKAALIQLTRQRIRTLIYFLIFALIFSGLVSSYLLLDSAENSKSTIMEQIGATITLDTSDAAEEDDAIFTQSVIQQLGSADHVIGHNQYYSDFALPVGFSNCRRFDGKDPAAQRVSMELPAETADYVVLEGDSNIQMIDLFRQNHAALAEGSFPTSDQPGAIISEQLAEDAGLNVGDVLSLTAYDRTASIKIQGIYQTAESFTVTDDNIVGKAVFAYSPYNRIYADLDTAAAFFDVDAETLYVTFYIDNPNNVDAVGAKMKAMDLDWDTYSLINTTQQSYNSQAAQIEATASMARTMLAFIAMISAVAVILVTSIWGEQSRFESGIFLALGTSKWYAFLQQIVTTFTVAIPACLLSLLCAKPLAALLLQIKDSISVKSSASHSQFVTGLESSASVTISSLSISGYRFCVLFVLITVVIACLVPMWCIFRLQPREILSRK